MADQSGTYRYNEQQRAEWITDILAAADDRPGHRAYALALAEYWALATPGDDSTEPAADSISGVTWKVECALSADFAAIHQAPPASGVHGGNYAHEYVRMRGEARRTALLAARERRLRAERGAAGVLADLLSLDSGADRENATDIADMGDDYGRSRSE